MLFTVLGVLALFLGDINTNTTDPGQDERLDHQEEGLVAVPPVTNGDGREIGDGCKESSLHLEEQINVQAEEPSLEEPVDGQSEGQSLVEPVRVHGEGQSLVEPVSVHGEGQTLVEPDSVHGEEQSLVEPDSVHGEEQSLVEPVSVHGEGQTLVEPADAHSEDSASSLIIDNVLPNVFYAESSSSDDSSSDFLPAESGCSHDDPSNVVSAEPGFRDDSVPLQPEELKEIIEINSQRYEIGAELGKGGFGTVFAGTRLQDGLQVAVKIADFKVKPVIHVDDFDEPLPSEIALHFLANKGPKVNELVQLLDWKVEADRYIMVLERPIPCVSVGDFLRGYKGRIPEHVLQKIMYHTTVAADTCNTRGVLHRDIKPDNLLMNPKTFEVKLIDFGCGDLLTDDYYSHYLGTMHYCPPEFNTAGYYFGEPATVWSLGILQYLLIMQ
nr:aurora kinase-like [Danio rerio]|eukprot:XP_009303866.1 aurora kinase-like [Danio rerio]